MLADSGAGHLPARLGSPTGWRVLGPGCVIWSASEDMDELQGRFL